MNTKKKESTQDSKFIAIDNLRSELHRAINVIGHGELMCQCGDGFVQTLPIFEDGFDLAQKEIEEELGIIRIFTFGQHCTSRAGEVCLLNESEAKTEYDMENDGDFWCWIGTPQEIKERAEYAISVNSEKHDPNSFFQVKEAENVLERLQDLGV